MYSGTTLTRASGRVLGAHQKIDRVARNHLSKLIKDNDVFPGTRRILHFEGKNGPDAIKRKSPAQDEPWHYYSPFDEKDSQLVDLINRHYSYLVKELKAKNPEKVAFEAAWLAHALVDGLTPAHHYPYEEKLAELRGEGNETRTTIKDKLVLPGETRREKVKNNWKMWGPKGLFTAHGMFELGIATLIAPLTFSDRIPTDQQVAEIRHLGLDEWFIRRAREIAVLDIFERYIKKGWTTGLAYDVRSKLAPAIINTVTLAWYMALLDSGAVKHKKS